MEDTVGKGIKGMDFIRQVCTLSGKGAHLLFLDLSKHDHDAVGNIVIAQHIQLQLRAFLTAVIG